MKRDRPRRFVVQRHGGIPDPHYDLMIEDGRALAAWRFERLPGVRTNRSVTGRKLADHRRAYLTYEGPVSGGRGRVRIRDAGTARVETCPNGRTWNLRLRGRRLEGGFVLQRKGRGDAWEWRRESEPRA